MNYDDPKLVAKAKREVRVREAEQKIVVKSIMTVRAGREWMYDFLSQCGIFQTPFTNDPCATAFNCGQQNVGLRMTAQIMLAAPTEYLQMLKEQDHGGTDDPEPDPEPELDLDD